jgi:very-short-patch-repair endonuclease
VAHRSWLLEQVSRGELETAVRTGRVVRVTPEVYALASVEHDRALRRRAAILYAGTAAALSHVSALGCWGVDHRGDGRVHVVVPGAPQLKGPPWLAVHRRQGPVRRVVRGGLPLTEFDRTVVDCWALLAPGVRREVVLDAVGSRRTTAERLMTATVPNLPGRRELRALLELITAGCRSELEIWGHLHVFGHPSLPRAERQYRITDGTRTAYADVAYPEFRVAVELDGAAHHGGREARERDLRRDTWLAAQGWLVLRFSHARLTAEPGAVRAEIAAVLASRGAPTGGLDDGRRDDGRDPTSARPRLPDGGQ